MSIEFFTGDLPVPHGFFGRRGGVSTGPYASLNASLSGGDDVESVKRNRALATEAIGAAPSSLLGLQQIHSALAITVTAPWPQGPSADAMVSNRPGLTLGIITADCAPVLFADQSGAVVGAAHAGWRGALGGILENTVQAMRALGSGPIKAVIGPCIQQASYEVGTDLRDAVLAHDALHEPFFSPGRPGHFMFDLPGYCAARLRREAVEVTILPLDTCADELRFFSHRRRTLAGGGKIGHQISMIRIAE